MVSKHLYKVYTFSSVGESLVPFALIESEVMSQNVRKNDDIFLQTSDSIFQHFTLTNQKSTFELFSTQKFFKCSF